MTAGAWLAIGLAAVAAVIDWWAVATRDRRLEYLAKPAVMVALIIAALLLDTAPGPRAWFVAALALSLAGDVFLMLRNERFVAGLASFLVAHLAYIVGMAVIGVSPSFVIAGAAVTLGLGIAIGRRIVGAVRSDQPDLTIPVALYVVVISLMLIAAVGTAVPIIALGAGLFYASDALLGWNRFVTPLRHGRLLVIVPYHLGQALLVIGLAGL